MATAPTLLTLEEFRERYAGQPYEYWFGEAIPKGMGTTPHGLLQFVLMLLFDRAGCLSAPEVELRMDPEWEPKPDVIADTTFGTPYPVKPVDIAVEVLSPDDKPGRLLEKCRNYHRIGVHKVYVFDPVARTARIWHAPSDELVACDKLSLPNGKIIPVRKIWLEFDRRIKRQAATS